jgi:hypothetical protein
MMELIKRSNIPTHYKEYKMYDPVGHRMKSPDEVFYLKSNSVVINCYGKYLQLCNNYPDNPSLEDSRSVIRFEIQCKYFKLYSMLRDLKRKDIPYKKTMNYLFSDAYAREVVVTYFDKVIMRGDYYTLKIASAMVKARKFRGHKEERMIYALNLISQQRGISGAKAYIRRERRNLLNFNRALNELSEMGINPVTIPKSFGIGRIPNLLEAYFQMEWSGLTNSEHVDEYLKELRKNNKRRAT